MSYIPRRPVATDERPPFGRVDEVRSSATPAAAVGTSSSHAKQPASRRSSVAQARANASPLPSLPPLPDADPGALSIARTASAVLSPGTHRRATSTGSEPRHAPEKAASSIRQPKPRRGLASLRVVWPSSKGRRSTSIEAPPERARWTADDTAAVAQTSLRAWKCGYPVDRDSLATDVGRSVTAVSEMLEYMLEGYARFGSAACWDSQSPKFIMRWAAVEFPSNPALNPPVERPRSAVSRLDACISALTCRPRSAAQDTTYALDSPEDAATGQVAAIDFRDEMRLRGVNGFPVPAAADSPPSESGPAATVGPSNNDAEQLTARGAPRARERSRSMVGTVQLPERRAAVLRDAIIQTDEPDSDPPALRPVRSGTRRTTQIIAASKRTPRAKAIRHTTARLESDHTAQPRPISFAWSPNGPFAPFAFSPQPASAGVVMPQPPPVVGVPMAPGTRARAATVAESARLNRRSRDSGTVETPVPIAAKGSAPGGAGNSELHSFEFSPHESRQTVEVGVLDDNLDVSFADIEAETRRKVRRFVAQFIQAYPDDFRKRANEYKRNNNQVLCLPADEYMDFDRHSQTIMAIESTYRGEYGNLSYTGSMFFHCQFVHAIRIDRIPVTEETWARVNEFATEVFNWQIVNADLVVMQEYMSRDGNGEGGAGPSRSSNWMLNGHVSADVLADDRENGRESPFGKAHFMDLKAQQYVTFLDETMGDQIRQRAKNEGPRPIPVALHVDTNSMLPVDRDIRSTIQSFIQEDLPDATAATKELVLLRSLERANAHMAKLCGYHEGTVGELLGDVNSDGGPAEDRSFATQADIRAVPSSQLAQVAGREFSRGHFERAKSAFLLAMLNDHPFRLVSRDEVKVWIERDGGPFGKDVDYRLNVGLYRYLRQLNLRPSSKQWLQTSAAATLSMLRRMANALDDQSYIEHLDIARYESTFYEAVQNASSSNSASNGGTSASRAAAEPAETTPFVRPRDDKTQQQPAMRAIADGRGTGQSSSRGDRQVSASPPPLSPPPPNGLPFGPELADTGFPMPVYGADGPSSPLMRQITVPMPGGSHRMPDPQECHEHARLAGYTNRRPPAGFMSVSSGGGGDEGDAYIGMGEQRAELEMPVAVPDIAAIVRKMREMESSIRELRALNGRL